MEMTIDEMYYILTEHCGANSDFMSGVMAIGGYTKETFNKALYYLTGYTDFRDYVRDTLGEEEEEEEE